MQLKDLKEQLLNKTFKLSDYIFKYEDNNIVFYELQFIPCISSLLHHPPVLRPDEAGVQKPEPVV